MLTKEKTKTLDQILKEAGYTKKTLDNYHTLWIINGCGGARGFDFIGFAKDTIKYFPKFDTEKHKQFIEDIKYICHLHDLDYILGDTLRDKFLADIRLARRVYRLLNWSTKIKRSLSATAIFTGTTIGGIKYFFDKEKYDFRLLITK